MILGHCKYCDALIRPPNKKYRARITVCKECKAKNEARRIRDFHKKIEEKRRLRNEKNTRTAKERVS